MSEQPKWEHKDTWTMRGNGFCVQVSRHSVESWNNRGEHRWCVYAYIYPTHPYFKEFEGDSTLQDAAMNLPLHGGPSLLTWHVTKDGGIGSVQVGADYDHLHDEGFTYCGTKESAGVVFNDAAELFQSLTKLGGDQ